MSDVSPEMARAALEWQAQEAAVERRADAAVAELVAPAAAPASAQATAAAAALDTNRAQLANLCGVAWTVLDRIITQTAGAKFALTPEEREQLVAATVPVAEKYLPADLSLPPEAMLAVTAGIIYGPRLLASDEAPAAPEAPAA